MNKLLEQSSKEKEREFGKRSKKKKNLWDTVKRMWTLSKCGFRKRAFTHRSITAPLCDLDFFQWGRKKAKNPEYWGWDGDELSAERNLSQVVNSSTYCNVERLLFTA